MHPLSFNDTDPLPLILGPTVSTTLVDEIEMPKWLTDNQRAWVDAYETTERDMAVRPQRFYSQCSADDPLGQRVRRLESGDGRAAGCMTDDEARERMVHNLRRSEHRESFLRGRHIDDLYALYLADAQAHHERELLQRIKSQIDRAMLDVVRVGSGAVAVRRGGELLHVEMIDSAQAAFEAAFHGPG